MSAIVCWGEIANRLRRALPEDQLVARVGGDEFVVVAPGLTDDDIERLCLRLIEIVTAAIPHDDQQLTVGLSIGVAVAPDDAITADDLLRCADVALYRSKGAGRGTYSFFAQDINERIIAGRHLANEMRRGLAANEFFLEYQPRFNARTQIVQSVEALVRWNHPERGRIEPLDFISLAEKNSLIVPLGEWVLRTACHAAIAWPGIGVSVNVSPVQFRGGDLVKLVSSVLAETGLNPELLELEITEGVLLDDEERAKLALNDLKALGVKLAMDDFGTGYSSLSYLRSFPFDVIKIDRRFIADIEKREGGRSIVQAILGLGKALGISVTAEGVETPGQLLMLTLDDCSEVQGFLLARPMSAEALTELLANNNRGMLVEDDHELFAATG